MRSTLVIADHGPAFRGWVARTRTGREVCVAPPTVGTDPTARQVVRELVTRLGGNCTICAGCFIGRE